MYFAKASALLLLSACFQLISCQSDSQTLMSSAEIESELNELDHWTTYNSVEPHPVFGPYLDQDDDFITHQLKRREQIDQDCDNGFCRNIHSLPAKCFKTCAVLVKHYKPRRPKQQPFYLNTMIKIWRGEQQLANGWWPPNKAIGWLYKASNWTPREVGFRDRHPLIVTSVEGNSFTQWSPAYRYLFEFTWGPRRWNSTDANCRFEEWRPDNSRKLFCRFDCSPDELEGH